MTADPSLPPPEPEASEAVTPRVAPPPGHQFPCRRCGAKLTFDPQAGALQCPYCGYSEHISASEAEATEHSLDIWLKQQSENPSAAVDAPHAAEVRCQACGAAVLLAANVEADRCPFCGTTLHNKPQPAGRIIMPELLAPFAVSQRQAIDEFNRWIASLWFAPNGLRDFANLGQLAGVYMPFWTYDSMTITWYVGQRGDDYQTEETYLTTNAQGEAETRTRMVTRTDWTRVSGRVDHFFDDVLICASGSLPTDLIETLEPWDLDQLKPFDTAYLTGFKTERYTVELVDGFQLARSKMAGVIQRLCCQDIGGDHQSLESVRTQHIGVTYKHILLPVWLAAYRYHDTTHRILINARTGEVTGTRPYSWAKISLAVATAFAVSAGAALAIWWMQN